jgi:hypothetical protein
MIALALEGVTAFSTMPLRLITLVGFIVSLVSFLLGAWALLAAFFSLSVVPGWASTVIPIYLICGVQLICLGIMGEYIGKIYHETKRRPRFTVETALPNVHSETGSSSMPLSSRNQQRLFRELRKPIAGNVSGEAVDFDEGYNEATSRLRSRG